MSGIVQEVAVVSFADGSFRNSLQEALLALDYRVSLLDREVWAAEPRLPGCVVLLIGKDGYPWERLVSTLCASDNPPVLAAFTCDTAEWDETILSACTDFFGWPCHRSELSYRVDRLIKKWGIASGHSIDPAILEDCMQLNMLGQSPALLGAVNLLKKFARCDAPVFIEGETGTGKELAARAIHYLGARRDYPFIPVNCGAIPDNLLENELFGHEKGAFTDAKDRQAGLIEQANGGTLFFDEVDALSDKGQVALLRFLEEQEYRPLGGKRPLKADVRILAATNADMTMLINAGRFRRDLMFRLNVLSVRLPPLRERGSDIQLLAGHFLHQYDAYYKQGAKTLAPQTMEWMLRHPWSGNIRELENLLHRYYLITEGALIHVPETGRHNESATNGVGDAEDRQERNFRQAKARAVAAFEKNYLQSLLAESGGNISHAARLAGKDRSALRRLLQKHGVNR